MFYVPYSFRGVRVPFRADCVTQIFTILKQDRGEKIRSV